MPEQALDRRTFLTGAASVAAAAAQTPTATQRPNILHIMTDQQQWATIAGRSRLPHAESSTGWRARDSSSSEATRPRRSVVRRAPCCLSGAYHWHNGVYNQVHSPPSVHRDMNPDVVLYSQRLRDAGYRLGYVGKWHASVSAHAARFRLSRGRRDQRLRSRPAAEAGSESRSRAALHANA